MKKSVIAALTGALVVGVSATTFAAANPFSDVPAGHWAYNSVTKLAQEGIIEGYGDGTFLGNRNITRYEMAQMIAKALAKNPQGATKAELDRLAAEFREELDNLGVRVAELEKHADKVKWEGKIEYTYNHFKNKDNGDKITSNGYVFRLEPKAEINDHWTAIGRLDAYGDMSTDSTTDVKLKRIYAQGDYDKFSVKLGRFGFCPSGERNIIWDTVISGGELSFGNKWVATITGGRIGGGDEAEYNSPISDNETNALRIGIQYNDPGDKGLYGGASWSYAKDHDFKYGRIDSKGQDYTAYSDNNEEEKASIWAANLGYRFNENLFLHGAYGRNTKADYEKDAWAILLRYGNYGDYANQGDWAVWLGYSKFGMNAGIGSNQGDDVQTGTKGWHIGAAYAPFKNVGILLRYADGKYLNSGDKFRKFFARGEFFF